MSTIPPSEQPPETGLQRGQVQTFVMALDKAMRAQRLYGSRDSAFVVKLLENLERELAELLAQGAVRLGVCSAGFTWDDRPLFTADLEDNQLPWAFRLFCDGIRELTFEQQMRWEELLDFLDILSTNPRVTEEDLVTLLWERDFDGIRYYAADTFAAGLEVDENGDLVLSRRRRADAGGDADADDIPLSSDDIRVLAGDHHLAWLRSAKAPARSGGAHAWQAARLKSSLQDIADLPRFMDMALDVVAYSRQSESVGLSLVTEQLQSHIGRRDQEGFEAFFLALGASTARGGERAAGIVARVLAPQRHGALVPMFAAADERLDVVPAQLLAARVFEPAKQLLQSLPACPFQQALEQALLDARVDLTLLYTERLGSNDHRLVSASIEALGRLGSVEAFKALATLLSSPSSRVRMQALQAMDGRYVPEAKGALLRALDDPSSELRVKVLGVLQDAQEPAVVRALVPHMHAAGFEKRSIEECAAWYRCLTSAQDAAVLGHLDKLLQRRNLLRNRTVMAHQMMAVRVLGQLDTRPSLSLLERALGYKHLPRQVRTAIKSAVASSGRAQR
jgi:hypothetical protein